MTYKLSSPAIQHDFENLLSTNPDIYTLVEWLKTNVDFEELVDLNPNDLEEFIDRKDLESWAEKEGWIYKPGVDDLSKKDLEEWAEDNDYVKREKTNTENIDKYLKQYMGEEGLVFDGDNWIVWDLRSEESTFEAETKEELNNVIGDYYFQREIQKRKLIEESVMAAKVEIEPKKAGKRGRKPGSKNGAVSQEDKAEKDLREFAKGKGLKIVKNNKKWSNNKYHIMDSNAEISMYAKTIEEAYDLINHMEDHRKEWEIL